MKLFRKISLVLLLFITVKTFAQPKWDTTKYVKYSDKLVVSTFLAWRYFDYTISQKGVTDTAGVSGIHYKPNTSVAWGCEMDYDKISVAFSIRAKVADSAKIAKGKSDFRNLALSLGGNKWLLETGFRSTTGFYDENTYNYDTTIKHTGKYYQNSSLTVQQLKAKFLFFQNNQRFAFKAGYGYTCRQLKTAFTWVGGANVYHNHLYSDSSIVPAPIRMYYGENAYLHSLKVSGVSAGFGGSLNIVLWKKLFVNLTEIFFIEPQWRTYSRIGRADSKICKVSASNDARASLAINAKNFFISVYGTWDIINMDNSNFIISSKAISGALSVGYRFKVKTPKFYQKIQQTKIYKML